MLAFIFAVGLTLLMLLTIGLDKTYHHLTRKEIQRRAREGDKQARKLYKPLSFGTSLELFLWLIIILSAAGAAVLYTVAVPASFAFLLIILVLGLGFWWLPASPVGSFGGRLAIWFAPLISWILFRLYPVFHLLDRLFQSHYPIHVHSGMYDKDDLIELLEQQKHQEDSRIPANDIEIAENALLFDERLVRDVMVPRKVVKSVNVSDPIGPVFIDDLHKTGHGRFPVYEGKRDNIVGLLLLQDLIDLKQAGIVRSAMHKKVYYVHEDYNLQQVYEAFQKTKHHLFIVVNNFEEFVGIVTIEDVLGQLVGTTLLNEFDQYENLQAVATSLAKQEHEEHQESGEEPIVVEPEQDEEQ